MNEEITAPTVRLIDEEKNSEELSIADAITRAQEEELDLIEISPKATPPVVKITDFGRYMYQQKKKDQKQKAHSKQTEVKMLRFSFRTEKHDLDRILDRAREFLAERHLVKLVVRLRGREMTNKDYARQKLTALVAELADVSEIEQEVKPQGNQFTAIVRPKRS
ncbi:translation initiation factor IF-3 [bacterium]|jgi:translation initiation factor IF-3|nr:translation initiation factor IF-3 [bacterium]